MPCGCRPTPTKGEWLRSTLEAGASRVLVVDAHCRARVEDCLGDLDVEHLVDLDDPSSALLRDTGSYEEADLHTGDTAAVLWTSGTTGRSKGVMQPHSAWIRAALTGAESSGVQDGDVIYCCLPMYNSTAWISCIYRALHFRDPAATLDAYRNLWYHTGDLGRQDAVRQFQFVDRKKDYIRFKGRSVSSFAVDAAVRAHDAVAEMAAFGVPTAELESESELMVAVVMEDGANASAEQIARFVNDTAPHFFVPRFIDIVDEIPHTPLGKVQKFEFRARDLTPTTWDRGEAGFEVVR